VQGADDRIYDFTQLINGNLVFVGKKGTASDTGLWAFVTDSTGKSILWEKQYNLPGVDAEKYSFNNILPMSVCATPDTGFIVVGDLNTYGNNHNACAFKFVPRPPLAGIKASRPQREMQSPIRYKATGKKVVFTLSPQIGQIKSFLIVDAAGRTVANLTSAPLKNSTIEWNRACAGKGVYFYQAQ
jgi:hypothetical protein